ncbi:MAG: YkgJ family cysteine cluster protein [Lachnotalea sp.]
MERNVSLNEISDGKLYDLNDLVKVGCNDCIGCFACCQGMGNSILLDPLDIYRLITNLSLSFEELLIDKIELNIVDGMIVPNLKMVTESEQCSFLNSEGRCSIHAFRPGICRLFPLGRYYEKESFKYFLQIHECKKDNKTKIKVRKWIDTCDIKNNEPFIKEWHYFLKDLQGMLKSMEDDIQIKNINMYVLNQFYVKPYVTDINFYIQFNDRLNEAQVFVDSMFNRNNSLPT